MEARVQFPSGALKQHGTPTGRATKLKPWRVWVRLPPVLLQVSSFKLKTRNLKPETPTGVGWRWDAGRSVKPPPPARQVRFLPDALVFGPLVYRQDTGFSTRRAGFNSPTDCLRGCHETERALPSIRLVKKTREGETIQTSYIPAEFAKVGRVVKIRQDDGAWDDGWVIRLVGGSMTEEQLTAIELAHRRFERATSKA